jgi:hypothetical protein
MAHADGAPGENNRTTWSFVPFVNVGPVRFGMDYDEAVAALGGIGAITRFDHGSPSERLMRGWAEFYEPAVTTYYDESKALACIAIDALRGPQVTMDGIPLVGRVPSELAYQFIDYAASRGASVVYSQQGDPGANDLGIVLRAQRAGDVLLTRPVFVAREWADRVADTSEGPVPQVEWSKQ